MDTIIGLLFFVGSCALIVIGFKKLGQQRAAKKRLLEKYEASLYGVMKHTSGLPFPGSVAVELFYNRDGITFKKGQQEIYLDCDKIISMDIVTGKNAQRQALSGAAAGRYLTGGTGGAVVGALLATKTYLVISCRSNDKVKHITLDTASSGLLAPKITKDFTANNYREAERMEL